jgi:hypothetical protein
MPSIKRLDGGNCECQSGVNRMKAKSANRIAAKTGTADILPATESKNSVGVTSRYHSKWPGRGFERYRLISSTLGSIRFGSFGGME